MTTNIDDLIKNIFEKIIAFFKALFPIQTNITIDLRFKLLFTILAIFFIWLIRFIIIKIVWKKTDIIKIRYSWKKSTGYASVFFIVLIVGIIWIEGFQSIAAFIGIISAALVFVLRDPVANITGWLFIISRRHLEVGDRIQIDNNAGDVIDINIFYFTLMEIGNWVNADQSTGRIIHVPNNTILSKPLFNYTKGLEFLWNEIPVIVTFESNWKKAKKILENIIDNYERDKSEIAEQKAKEAAKKFLINYSKFTPIVYTTVIEYGITLTIRYLCEPRKRRITESEIWERILIAIAKHNDIDFAYPTQRFYDNYKEGKHLSDKK